MVVHSAGFRAGLTASSQAGSYRDRIGLAGHLDTTTSKPPPSLATSPPFSHNSTFAIPRAPGPPPWPCSSGSETSSTLPSSSSTPSPSCRKTDSSPELAGQDSRTKASAGRMLASKQN